MSKIKEILLARRNEVLAEIAPLKAEIREIDAALAAIGAPVEPRRPKPEDSAKPITSGTVIGQAQILLREAQRGLVTREIVEQIKARFGREISARNMSWHMSRMKREGLVTQTANGLWKLAGQNEETPPEEQSDGASITGGGDAPPIESLGRKLDL